VAKKLLGTSAAPVELPVTGKEGRLTPDWLAYFGRMPDTLGAIPSILNVVSLDSQTAAISSTDFSGADLLVGIYQIIYHARITTAAGTSSSLTVTFTWTEGGVAQTYSGAAITGNTTATHQSGVVMIRSDTGTTVNYSTAYASTPASAMNYSFDVALKLVQVL